jgi:hypothetical protein
LGTCLWNEKVNSMKSRYIVLAIGASFLVLVAPIGFYTWKFGLGLWSSHEDWAFLGTTIGGLYTPILSLLTLVLLGYQSLRQTKIEQHNQDVWYIERAISSGNKSLSIMDDILTKLRDMNHSVTYKPNKLEVAQMYLFGHGSLHSPYSAEPQISQELRGMFFINSDIYFEQLGNLKGKGEYFNSAYIELKNDALMRFDYKFLRKCEEKGNYLDKHFLR